MRREYVEGHASLCGGGATKVLRARLVALEEGLEFGDVVRYRKLGRALHTHNTGGGGGSSGAERSQGKKDKGFFGWFQKKEEPPAAAAEPQGLEVATAAAAAAASSDSGVIDEQALQRLGDMLELSDTKGGLQAGFGVDELRLAGVSEPRAYARATVTVHVPGLHVCLYEAGLSELLELRLESLAAAARYRPVHGGLGLQLSVGGLLVRDAATPYPQLRVVGRSGQAPTVEPLPADTATAESQAEDGWVRSRDGGLVRVGAPGATAAVYGEADADAGGTASFLQITAELEPVDSDEVLILRGEVESVQLLFNPALLAALLRFVAVPHSHWAAATELEAATSHVVTQLVGAVRDSSRSLQGRPLAIDLTLCSPRVLIIEPPPPPSPPALPPPPPTSATATTIAVSIAEAAGDGSTAGAKAEALVSEGHAANKRGNAMAAQRCFDAAYALDGKPSTSLSAANMTLKQGGPRNGAAAAARYQQLLERGDLSPQQREVATRKLLEFRPLENESEC